MDYKEKYEQALERARQFSEKPYLEDSAGIVEYIFPELKESEDEMIRKRIIALVNAHGQGMYKEKMLAWLEQKGEDIDNANKEYWRGYREGKQEILDKYAELEKRCEQKPTVPKFKIGQTIKKEGFNIGFTIAKIENGFYYDTTGSYFPINDEENWKLVGQKPAEWSEEDENHREAVIDILVNNTYSGENGKNVYSKEIDWLKSLRSQSHWKPSGEQLDGLKEAIEFLGCNKTRREQLQSLYEQLKKLGEE